MGQQTACHISVRLEEWRHKEMILPLIDDGIAPQLPGNGAMEEA